MNNVSIGTRWRDWGAGILVGVLLVAGVSTIGATTIGISVYVMCADVTP
jgi:hypothetical protein